MGEPQELIEAPVSGEELVARYRALYSGSAYRADLAGLFD